MTTARKAEDHGEAEVQAKKDAEDAQGFVGHSTDPTPDEHYTVPGVLAGKPTPETDLDHRAKVRAVTEAGR
jgi:hypothetical protein